MEESDNMKIIVDKDKFAYTICLCMYNVTPALAGQMTLVASNEMVIFFNRLVGAFI
jgi:hypothetical protein